MGLLEQAASLPALRAALDVAARRRGAPGPDGVSIADFAARGAAALGELSQELLSGAYRPRPARRVPIPKPGGGYRHLAIGCVRDRVAAHALAATLSAALDAELHPCAFAYRRGRSTKQALEAVDAALAAGREWVLRADIESFFDQIDGALLLDALSQATAEPPLVALIERMLGAGLLCGGEIADVATGAPQGLPLSPLLSNLYLLPFDRAVEQAGLAMVRYGDDLCVCALSRDEAQRAREVVTEALGRLRLRLNSQKIEVRHRGEGFTYLGFSFGPIGRRPGPRAARALQEKIEALLRERPVDAQEEVDDLLRGWLGYYGSLSGVDLPEAVRARAEALEAARSERIQLGPRARAGIAPADAETLAGRSDDPGEAASPFERAAAQLAQARGADAEAALHGRLRAELRIPEAAWPSFAEALARRDGGAAAEVLARLGRFADAGLAAELRPAPGVRAAADAPDDPPHLAPRPTDAERMLELFAGAEHVFLRDRRGPSGVLRERVHEPPGASHAREHLGGAYWMGTYPLRANRSVRFGGIRVVGAAKLRQRQAGAGIPEAVADDARRLLRALRAMGLAALVSLEPGRGYMLWLLLDPPQPAARVRAVLARALEAAGPAPAGVTREVVPAQEVARPDRPGTPALWPLGLDPRTGERAWLLDEDRRPLPHPLAVLRDLAPQGEAALARTLAPLAPPPLPAGSGVPAAAAPEAVAPPFGEQPRAREVYQGCNVLRHLVDKAMSGGGLQTSERHLVTDVLGRLGDEAAPALEAVFRHLVDYRPGMGQRHLLRVYPYPTSCARIRSKLPELTARVGCDCRFRVPPGAYPTPVLHALGAAEVPGLGDRVRAVAARGGLARAATAAMNEGRKELGQRAAALCARLSDLRRQARLLERSIAAVEADLDAVLDEAGDEALETPSGALRRVRDGGTRRFVIEV